MLEFRNVSVSCQHMPILNDISLTFRDGEITTILGPNGCGKTTLVQCLNGASTVTAGQIFLNGQDFLKIFPERTCPGNFPAPTGPHDHSCYSG